MARLLRQAVAADIRELMNWFDSAEATQLWAGPKFRYPFTQQTFQDDCRWQDFDSYCLVDDNEIIAFGQIGTRYKRCHFARLAVKPEARGKGLGRYLLTALMEAAEERYGKSEFGLFVYRHNAAALRCYQSLNYQISDYPVDAPMQDECYYLIR